MIFLNSHSERSFNFQLLFTYPYIRKPNERYCVWNKNPDLISTWQHTFNPFGTSCGKHRTICQEVQSVHTRLVTRVTNKKKKTSERRERPIEMWRESFPLVQTWIGCVDCHPPHTREAYSKGRAVCGSCRSTSAGPPRSVRGPTVEQLVDVPRCPKTSGRLGGSAQVNWHRLPHSTPLITSYIYEPAGKRPRFLQPTSQWAHYHQWIALDRPLQLHQTHHVRHQLRIRPRLLPLHAPPPHNTK